MGSIGTLIELNEQMIDIDDEHQYVAIDWNEDLFFAQNEFNDFNIVFEQCLDDLSVIQHFDEYSKSVSIGDCIREFQKKETLTEYFCEQCNEKNEATKSLQIWSTPIILILHFKRTGNHGRKINTNIDYLLNNFDVSPFLVSSESQSQCLYNLFGAINHYGAAGGGHYIANCLCFDEESESSLKWCLFDDHCVSNVSPMDVKSKNAYLLFYIRSDIQSLFVDHLVNKSDIQIDKHFAFLPQSVRNLIGNELNEEQIKLLNSEGVETLTTKKCVIL